MFVASKVYQLLDFEFQQMAQDRMNMFPILEAKARRIISDLAKSAFSRCKDSLEEYMDMEDMIYTQASIFSSLFSITVRLSAKSLKKQTHFF